MASGADNRAHNQGNQGRSYTVEQKAAVLRIKKCSPTSFYEILDIESVRKTCSEGDIKKAYRKQSLLTHPDKNGHEWADEAFKMVSRAFGVLGDKEKRDKYDRYGGDPDSRFGAGSGASTGGADFRNPFSGFGGMPGGGGMPRRRAYQEAEISPEEMFARFFGGGGGGFGGGPFGGFDAGGPGVFFDFGGGPGIRVHQFGGGRPRTRPREAGPDGERTEGSSTFANLMGLLPVLMFFILPIIMGMFGDGDGPSKPHVVFEQPQSVYTMPRTMYGIPADMPAFYYVSPEEIKRFNYGESKLVELDKYAAKAYKLYIKHNCEEERRRKQALREQANGIFWIDHEKMALADKMKMPNCEKKDKLRI